MRFNIHCTLAVFLIINNQDCEFEAGAFQYSLYVSGIYGISNYQ